MAGTEAAAGGGVAFSVVMPLYNGAAWVGRAVGSVLGQAWRDFELIVVDDGSTDDGPARVQHLGDARIRLLRQPNAGVAAARNAGIASARGNWVVFLDADDVQAPSFLACIAAVQRRHPAVDTIATLYRYFTGAQMPPLDAPGPQPEVELVHDLPARWMQGPAFFTSSVAVRTSRLRALGACFPSGESVGEDLDLWFRLAEQGPIALVRSHLVGHRLEVAGSLSSRPAHTVPPFLLRLEARARREPHAARRRSMLLFAAQLRVDLARAALARGQRLQALHWLGDAQEALAHRRWWVTLGMALLLPRRWMAPLIPAHVLRALGEQLPQA